LILPVVSDQWTPCGGFRRPIPTRGFPNRSFFPPLHSMCCLQLSWGSRLGLCDAFLFTPDIISPPLEPWCNHGEEKGRKFLIASPHGVSEEGIDRCSWPACWSSPWSCGISPPVRQSYFQAERACTTRRKVPETCVSFWSLRDERMTTLSAPRQIGR
jgi:hypothetical protein